MSTDFNLEGVPKKAVGSYIIKELSQHVHDGYEKTKPRIELETVRKRRLLTIQLLVSMLLESEKQDKKRKYICQTEFKLYRKSASYEQVALWNACAWFVFHTPVPIGRNVQMVVRFPSQPTVACLSIITRKYIPYRINNRRTQYFVIPVIKSHRQASNQSEQETVLFNYFLECRYCPPCWRTNDVIRRALEGRGLLRRCWIELLGIYKGATVIGVFTKYAVRVSYFLESRLCRSSFSFIIPNLYLIILVRNCGKICFLSHLY